jgi:regulator of replication initiation timing
MTLKETFKQLRVLLSIEPTEVKLEKATLKDGITIVEADSFAVDSPIFIVTENGDQIPMPIGVYELEDGSIIEVIEDGVIGVYTAVSDVPVEEVPVEAEDVPTEEVPVEDVPVESVSKEEFDAKIAELTAMIDELKNQLGLSKEEISAKEVEMEKLKLELSQLPAVKKIGNTPKEDVITETITNKQTATKFAKILNNIK